MLFVSTLSEEEIRTLQSMAKKHPLHWTRIRANAVLFSNQGIPLQKIASINGVCRQTLSIWLKSWEKDGICGLIDKPGRGRKKNNSPRTRTGSH